MKINLPNITIDSSEFRNLPQAEKDALLKELGTKKGLWKPKNANDQYYLIDEKGKIETVLYSSLELTENLYKIGNCFQTRELAQKELDIRIATQAVKEFIAENDLGWESGNWDNIYWDGQLKMFESYASSYSLHIYPYGKIKAGAGKKLISAQESNLKIIFGVK